MANNLAAIARSSYCTAGNNVLRDYEPYDRPGEKKITVDINRSTVTCTYFCTRKFRMLSKKSLERRSAETSTSRCGVLRYPYTSLEHVLCVCSAVVLLQETTRRKEMYVIILLDPISIIFEQTIKLFVHLKIKFVIFPFV